MPPLVGPLHAAAAVLALAGLAKLARPSGTAAALRVLGLPGRRWTARALGAVEVAAAGWVLAGGGRAGAAALAAFHVGFTVAALVLRRRAATCGCFGDGAPVGLSHLVVTSAVSVIAFVGIVDPVPSLGSTMGAMPGAGLPYLGLVALLAALEVACLTVLADAQAAGRLVAT
jgi:hypothetical protein